jgi:hypothetical protein
MTDNTSSLIEVEVTSDEADISIEESDDIATNEEAPYLDLVQTNPIS